MAQDQVSICDPTFVYKFTHIFAYNMLVTTVKMFSCAPNHLDYTLCYLLCEYITNPETMQMKRVKSILLHVFIG